jgi:hypothetical protein
VGIECGGYESNDSLESFLVTLKNPHNIPAKRLQLRADQKDRAIDCTSNGGPFFLYGIWIYDQGNANTRSNTNCCCIVDTNDTGLNENTFFADAMNFTVKEVEVFEIAD